MGLAKILLYKRFIEKVVLDREKKTLNYLMVERAFDFWYIIITNAMTNFYKELKNLLKFPEET